MLARELLSHVVMRSDLIEPNGVLWRGRGTAYRAQILQRIARIIDYLFGVLYVLLLVRLGLEVFGAQSTAGFVQIIEKATDVFYAPFKGIFPITVTPTGHIVWSLVAAVVGYMLLHAGIRGLLRLFARE